MLIKSDNIIVSAYSNKMSKSPNNVNLLKAIMTHECKDLITELRSYEYHSEEYDELKLTRLPMFWCGTYNEGQAKTIENINLAPIIIIDIDLQDNPSLIKTYSMMDWKYSLIEQNDAIVVALSSGGKGLFVVHRLSDKVDKQSYIYYFNKLKKRYKEEFGLVIDESCKNANRGRYVTYDPDLLYNQIYEPLELEDSDIKEPIKKQSSNVSISFNNDTYNLNESLGPFYFGHSSRHPQIVDGKEIAIPLISSIIHTLLCLYPKEEVKEIWKHPKFYSKEHNSVLRWIDSYTVKDENFNDVPINEWKPKIEVIKFLNNYCGFNIRYSIESKNSNIYDCVEDWLWELNGKQATIDLNDCYLYDKKDEILSLLGTLYPNMIDCKPGKGKTTFFNKLRKECGYRICIIQPFKSIVKSKYKNTDAHLCVESNKIKPEYEYIVTHYNNFVNGYEKNTLGEYDFLVIDESHLIGTQSFRTDIILKCIKYCQEYNKQHKNCKLIFMTGTPTNENYLLDNSIHNIIRCESKETSYVSIHYMNMLVFNKTINGVDTYTNNIIQNILYLSNIAKNEGRKVYIYWGTGSIENEETYRKAADILNKMNIAIYHRKNEHNEDLDYIRNEERIGNYDGMMSSCYFSVGCDLNDEQSTQIIIIGNNTYQEDYQVRSRFRKSKNIKITVLLDKLLLKKYDCDYWFQYEVNRLNLLSKSSDSKQTSLVYKETSDNDIKKKAYIKTSTKYFSDIKRKFEFYKQLGWQIFNDYYYENKEYTITENTPEGNMPIIYLLDNTTDTIKRINKETQNRIQDIKNDIIHNLKVDNQYDLINILNESVKHPRLQDWIEGMMMIQHHYDISSILRLDNKVISEISKSKLNSLVRWRINYEHNDKIENWIIERILDRKEEIKENIDKELAIYYICWCSAYEENNDYSYSTYDLNSKYSYPVFNQWKQNIISILNINDDVREIIMKDVYKKEFIDETTKLFFDIQDNNLDEKIKYVHNKYINRSDVIRFFNAVINDNDKEKRSLSQSELGKKKCIITDKFKHPEKYNLRIGQTFKSCKDLSNFTNKSKQSVSSWIKKGWIIES